MMRRTQCNPAAFPPGAFNSSTEIASASSERTCASSFLRRPLAPIFAAALFALLLPTVSATISLSHQEAMRIGRRIWQNECGGTVAGLTSWNAGENFASLGIGHFIWYPAGERRPFEESFPRFVRYVERRGAKLPDLLLGRDHGACPWHSREEFRAAESSQRMKQLRSFLSDTIDLQADFMVERLQEALPKMLAAAPAEARTDVQEQFVRVAGSSHGCYALIDYVNFKGEGVLPSERYQGRGWGLLQVLEEMSGRSPGPEATKDFGEAAARILRQRVEVSPPARDEKRWLPGWLNRVASYRG
jgi:hypothetical protein